jgi:hypothetical protein
MSDQSEPLTLWIDRRLVLRTSGIHDIGTFAIELIPAGQLLILTTGGLVLTPQNRASRTRELAAELYRVQARVVRKGEPPLVVLRWCLQERRT